LVTADSSAQASGTKLDAGCRLEDVMKKKNTMRSDRANAFVAEPETGEGPPPDDLAEFLGENFLQSATGGEDSDEVLHEELAIGEVGGPFVETDERTEFSRADDKAAAREPGEPEAFPTATRSGRGAPITARRFAAETARPKR
jgi:hypothetical protein